MFASQDLENKKIIFLALAEIFKCYNRNSIVFSDLYTHEYTQYQSQERYSILFQSSRKSVVKVTEGLRFDFNWLLITQRSVMTVHLLLLFLLFSHSGLAGFMVGRLREVKQRQHNIGELGVIGSTHLRPSLYSFGLDIV